jgi:ketosteroid isomerase-like protein
MRFAGFAIIAGLGITACAWCAQPPKDAIERQYKRWEQASLTNDVDAVLAILAPDYTLKTFTGKVIAHDAYEASLRKRKASGKPSTGYETVMVDCKVSGPSAAVISDETSTNIAPDPVTNKDMKLIHIHRYLDTWARIDGEWRLRSTVTQVEKTKIFPCSSKVH